MMPVGHAMQAAPLRPPMPEVLRAAAQSAAAMHVPRARARRHGPGMPRCPRHPAPRLEQGAA
jgi:hypothetical protein